MSTEDVNDDIVAMEADSEPVTVPRGVLRAVLDVAVTSMDFGSGFLNDADVEALRRLAVAIGTDPDAATPSTHTCKYKGTHRWTRQSFGALGGRAGWYCVLCHHSSETDPELGGESFK